MKLSVVATLYRSRSTIDEFVRRALAAAEAVTRDVELVLVNDGSPDDSFERAMALHRADPRIVVVDLSRNFGHHKAMMTGLKHAAGDLIFLIDSDLEEEPELLTKFHARFTQGDCDVVYGVQDARRGHWFERVSGAVFYKLVSWLSDHPIPRNLLTARLMTRQYVKALLRHRDRSFTIAHLWAITGFRQIAVPAVKHALSPTTYSMQRRIEIAVHLISTSSTRLLYLILYLGLGIVALSVAMVAFVLVRYATHGIGAAGYTSIFLSIWFFGGLTTLILALLGIYLANIFSETKRSPYTVVRDVHRAPAPAALSSDASEQP